MLNLWCLVASPALRMAPPVMQMPEQLAPVRLAPVDADRPSSGVFQPPLAPRVTDAIVLQGGSLRTWSYRSSAVEQVQLVLTTEGRPLDANIELWHGPDNTPCRMRVYGENGKLRPFSAVITTPRGPNTVAIRNIGQLEFPFAANVLAETPGSLSTPSVDCLASGTTIQGGALRIYPFDPSVDSVAVLLNTDGRPLNARIELLQGPNTNKQVVELYTEDGHDRPFFCVLETPGSGNVVSVVNTAPIEFPITASVVAHSITKDIDSNSAVIGGDIVFGGDIRIREAQPPVIASVHADENGRQPPEPPEAAGRGQMAGARGGKAARLALTARNREMSQKLAELEAMASAKIAAQRAALEAQQAAIAEKDARRIVQAAAQAEKAAAEVAAIAAEAAALARRAEGHAVQEQPAKERAAKDRAVEEHAHQAVAQRAAAAAEPTATARAVAREEAAARVVAARQTWRTRRTEERTTVERVASRAATQRATAEQRAAAAREEAAEQRAAAAREAASREAAKEAAARQAEAAARQAAAKGRWLTRRAEERAAMDKARADREMAEKVAAYVLATERAAAGRAAAARAAAARAPEPERRSPPPPVQQTGGLMSEFEAWLLTLDPDRAKKKDFAA